MRFATSNTCQLPLLPQNKVVVNHKDTFDNANMIAWQENGPKRYKDDLLANKRFDTYIAHYDSQWYDSPISIKSRIWKRVDAGAALMAHGQAHIEGDRYVTWVLLQQRFSKKQILMLSAHLVPRAFRADGSPGPRPDKREAAEQPARQAIWHAQMRVIESVIDPYIKAGVPIVLAGDFNRNGTNTILPKVYRGRAVHDFHHGIDHLIFIEGSKSRWKFGNQNVVHNYSDHAVYVKSARIVKR